MSEAGLEAWVTRGAVIFIDSIHRAPRRGQVAFYLVGTEVQGRSLVPLFGRVVRVLTFTEIDGYAELWDEGKEWCPNTMYSIIGIWDEPEDGKTRYHILLGGCEMTLRTAIPPTVEDLDSDAAQ